jgi:hypothetical protein
VNVFTLFGGGVLHGLRPDDIKHLEHLRDQDVIQVAVGEHQLQFATGPARDGGISVEGRCELIDPAGKMIDVWDRGRRSVEFRFLDLLGKTIRDVLIDSPKSFVVKFEDGSVVRFLDNSDKYESFSVGGLFV